METFPAHILRKDGCCKIQGVMEHCINTANYAKSCLDRIGLGNAAFLAGLLHDMGKCTLASKRYQEAVSRGENVRRGSVIHTFQCCRYLLEKHNNKYESYEDISRELLAFAASAHHGLYDCYNEDRESGFLHRKRADNIDYERARKNFLAGCGGENSLDIEFQKAAEELETLCKSIAELPDDCVDEEETEKRFYLGCIARLLLSAVIEGDRRDTAEFMSAADFKDWPDDMRKIWEKSLKNTEEKIESFISDTQIQKARRTISDHCRERAEDETGIFRLNVPTGSGKTISGLRFALAHAKKWNKRRIIFTSPLLSILEQNARIWREFIGNNSIILEHHSNIINAESDQESLDNRELLAENWNVPVVITTLVQLLNTMFLGKTTSVRRFWALCDSVIVIDEVQTVPNHMLSIFNQTVNFLAKYCRTTIVLCSATQPCLEAAKHPIRGMVKDIVPYDRELWSAFSRTSIVDAGRYKLEDVPNFAVEIMETADSLLIVCNKTAQASYLYNCMTMYEGIDCFHLSARMCMADRRRVLKELDVALKNSRSGGSKILCIATQVIEAGVDISFGAVIRLTAGIDNVIQAAGRCNRNGESSGRVPVYIVTCIGENLRALKEIQMFKDATEKLLDSYKKHPEKYNGDLASDMAVEHYYRALYRAMSDNYQDYPIANMPAMYSLLSDNIAWSEKGDDSYCLTQAFRTAGAHFQVFDDHSEVAVVPYGKGAELISELTENSHADLPYLKRWLTDVKPYTVSFYEYEREKLEKGGMYSIAGVWILQPGQYREGLGIITDTDHFGYWEV